MRLSILNLTAGLESLAPAPYSVAFIAELAHEHVRSYNALVGDEQTVAWAEAPEWQRESAIDGVLFYLKNPTATAEQVHENWLNTKREEGWSCGELKDPVAKTHPCMVPYAELSLQHKLKDHLFMYTVNAFIECFNEEQITELSTAEQSDNDWYGQTTPTSDDLSAGTEGFIKSVKDIWYAVTLSKENNEKRKDKAAKERGKLVKPEWPSEDESKIRKALKNLIEELEDTYGDSRWVKFRQNVDGKVEAPKTLVDGSAAIAITKLAAELDRFDGYVTKLWDNLAKFYTAAESSHKRSGGDLTEALEIIDSEFSRIYGKIGPYEGIVGKMEMNGPTFKFVPTAEGTVKVSPIPTSSMVSGIDKLTPAIKEMRSTANGVYWLANCYYWFSDPEDQMATSLSTHAEKKLLVPLATEVRKLYRAYLEAISDLIVLLGDSVEDVKDAE